jgi:PHD/YefM family antitoxin component YafN of YafNO toxin-antitoxin module
MAEQTLSISEAQRELTSLPDKFEEGVEAVTVTRYGKPVMDILPHQSYLKIQEMREIIDSLLETIEILQDEETMAALRQGVKELAEGQGQPLDDVLKELGWE